MLTDDGSLGISGGGPTCRFLDICENEIGEPIGRAEANSVGEPLRSSLRFIMRDRLALPVAAALAVAFPSMAVARSLLKW